MIGHHEKSACQLRRSYLDAVSNLTPGAGDRAISFVSKP